MESVRIALTLAALSDLEVKTLLDVEKAYLTALTEKKLNGILGPLGQDQ